MTDDAPAYGVPFMAFTLDHDEDDAAARFTARYGAPPERIIEYLGTLRLGPIPDNGERVHSGYALPANAVSGH